MLLVDTYIDVQKDGQIGLFATKDIERGTQIWKFHKNTAQVFWKKQYLSVCMKLATPALIDFIKCSYIKGGNIYFLNDNTKYISHSLSQNVAFQTERVIVAVENIMAGQEITQNYLKSYDVGDFIFIDNLFVNPNHQEICDKLKAHFAQIGRAKSNFLVK